MTSLPMVPGASGKDSAMDEAKTERATHLAEQATGIRRQNAVQLCTANRAISGTDSVPKGEEKGIV